MISVKHLFAFAAATVDDIANMQINHITDTCGGND